MRITYEMLKKKRACTDGRKWFRKEFPNGGDILEVIAALVWQGISNPLVSRYNTLWLLNSFSTREMKSYIYTARESIRDRLPWRSLYYSNKNGYWAGRWGQTKENAYNLAARDYKTFGGE